MTDTNTVLAVLAAALAPHLAAHFGNSGAGNPAVQNGAFGGTAQQNPNAFAGAAQQNGNLPQNFVGNAQAAQAQTNTNNPFGGPVNTAQGPTVTADMIQTLIAPLVQNEQVKAELTKQMQAMGIQNLPDTRPEQMAELYQRFQQIDQMARQAGMIGGAQGAQPSII